MHITETIPSQLELSPDFISSLVEKLYHLPLDEHTVFNIKLGLQEAVINAIEHGLSIKLDRMPATPERILDAIRASENHIESINLIDALLTPEKVKTASK